MSVTARMAIPAVVLGAVLAAVLAVGLSGVSGARSAVEPGRSDGVGRIVMVSGRDDHGLVASERVAVLVRPGGRAGTGMVRDGTLAEVLDTDGEWLELRTVEGRPVRGWLNDFYLRGNLHLVGTSSTCTTRLGHHMVPDGEQVTVRSVRGDRVRVSTVRRGWTGWVVRAAVQEVAPTGSGCL